MKNYKTSAYAAYNAALAEVNVTVLAADAAFRAQTAAADRLSPLLEAARAETKAVVDAVANTKRAAAEAEDAAASTIKFAKSVITAVITGNYDAAHAAYKAAYRKSQIASYATDAACKAFRIVYIAAIDHTMPWAANPRAAAKAKATKARRAINISTEAAAKAARDADSPVALGALEAAARALDAVACAVADAVYARHAATEACNLAKKAGV